MTGLDDTVTDTGLMTSIEEDLSKLVSPTKL